MATATVFCLFLTAFFIQSSHVNAGILPKFGFLDRLAVPHIIGGREANPSQIPYQARIDVAGGKFCGGVLISDTWVLTTAHCIHGYDTWEVRLGVVDASRREPAAKVYTSKTAIKHELYDDKNLYHDIGLIKLPEPVPLSTRIKTIPMAGIFFKDTNLTGSSVRVSGWGSVTQRFEEESDILQYLDLTVIDRRECLRTFSDIPETVLCAVGHKYDGACYGDSGGPLVIKQNGMDVVIGVLSFVKKNSCEGNPAGFTNVAYYQNWIKSNTRE